MVGLTRFCHLTQMHFTLAKTGWIASVEELKDAKVLLSMLSRNSKSRPWINFEAGAAWMGNTKDIPVFFGGLSIASLPKPYSTLQAVDIETYEGSFYLVSSIAHYLDLPQPEKPIFSDHPAMVLLATSNPEANKKLVAPYKKLQRWMRLFKDVAKQP